MGQKEYIFFFLVKGNEPYVSRLDLLGRAVAVASCSSSSFSPPLPFEGSAGFVVSAAAGTGACRKKKSLHSSSECSRSIFDGEAE